MPLIVQQLNYLNPKVQEIDQLDIINHVSAFKTTTTISVVVQQRAGLRTFIRFYVVHMGVHIDIFRGGNIF